MYILEFMWTVEFRYNTIHLKHYMQQSSDNEGLSDCKLTPDITLTKRLDDLANTVPHIDSAYSR